MPSVASVTIVGAGSAGWLTALSLSIYCPFLKIRLIRPSSSSPIGVGESTQADFVRQLRTAGLDLQAFLEACDATMKCGILYKDWNAVGHHYWHPFSDLSLGKPYSHLNLSTTYTLAHHYQQMILRNPAQYTHAQYYSAVHTSYDTCVKHNQVAPESAVAVHVDAKKLTKYLERVLTAVEVLDADNVDVRVADGRIDGIVLDGSKTITADLYVDCTGFARALLKRVAVLDFLGYEANVNRVVVAQIPYVDIHGEVTPYTNAHAHEDGWTWSIPLQSRIGSGYVYHGDFCSPEQAERNFREYWGMERMRDIEVRHIYFDSATLRNPWVENVVAIGLSAGFTEPLEATGLNWIITSADILSQYLTGRYYDADTAAKYNFVMLGYVYDIQDFIDVHYKLSARRDSEYWKYQASRSYPDRLEHRLALYAAEMPNNVNRIKSVLWAFQELSWIDILNGYEFEYAKLDVDPKTFELAQQGLRAVASQPRRGVAPLQYVPPS